MDSSRPLRSRRKDTKTGRHPILVPSPLASSRLRVRHLCCGLKSHAKPRRPRRRDIPTRTRRPPCVPLPWPRISWPSATSQQDTPTAYAPPARQPLAARVGIGIGIENSPINSRAPSCLKLTFTPRRRARRGWNTHSTPVSSLRTESMLQHETKAQESRKKIPGIHRLLPAVVQRTAQFIRTLRNGIVPPLRWPAALPPLRTSMTAYLSHNTNTIDPPHAATVRV
jgi:hypothetical protein